MNLISIQVGSGGEDLMSEEQMFDLGGGGWCGGLSRKGSAGWGMAG